MKNVMLFLAFIALAVVSGCSKKSEGAAAATGAFLTPASFSSATPTALTADEVKDAIEDESDLYDNKPTSGSSGSTSGADNSLPDGPLKQCSEANQPKATIVNKETLNISSQIDFIECIRTKAAAAGQQAPDAADAFKVNYVVNITCPNADLSAFSGKTVEELGLESASSGIPSALEEKCKNLPSVKVFLNAQVELSFAYKFGSQSGRVTSKIKSGIFSKDGSACELVKVDGGYKSNGCLNASLKESDSPNPMSGETAKKTTLTILESVNLIDLDAGTAQWFNGGQFNTTFNNFTGTVSYTNSTTAPTYSLTAAGGLSATGTVGGTTLPSQDPTSFESVASETIAHPFANLQKQLKHSIRRAYSVVR